MTRLAIICAGVALVGCERWAAPTANDLDDMAGHPETPLRRDAPTCGETPFVANSRWAPADSGAVCSDGFQAEQVGYTLSPVDGSCEKAEYTLHGYRAIYGCIKRRVITREEYVRDSLWWEGEG